MKKLLSSFIIIFSFMTAAAQGLGDRLTETTVTFYNNSYSTKVILLGKADKLDTFKLKEGAVWFSPSFGFDPLFRIHTQSQVVEYQLRLGETYMIYWNNKKNYWDLKKTKKRG